MLGVTVNGPSTSEADSKSRACFEFMLTENSRIGVRSISEIVPGNGGPGRGESRHGKVRRK